MSGLQAVFLLLAIVLMPLVPVFIWFKKKNFGTLRFLLAVTAGVLTVLIAALLQSFFPLHLSGTSELVSLLFGVFIRVSLIEELCRALLLFLLFHFIPYSKVMYKNDQYKRTFEKEGSASPFFGAASGLAAGLGFAAAESIFYSLSNPGIALLRLSSAAVHAACGIRTGAALGIISKSRFNAFTLFISAFLIHSIYNFSVLNPVIPVFLPVFIAFAALASSLVSVYFGSRNANIY